MEYIAPDEDGLVTLQDHIEYHGRNLTDRLISTWAIEFCHVDPGFEAAWFNKGIQLQHDNDHAEAIRSLFHCVGNFAASR